MQLAARFSENRTLGLRERPKGGQWVTDDSKPKHRQSLVDLPLLRVRQKNDQNRQTVRRNATLSRQTFEM